MVGLGGNIHQSAHCASKPSLIIYFSPWDPHHLNALSIYRPTASELSGYSITVNAYAPGTIGSETRPNTTGDSSCRTESLESRI
ncbi:hypothetical protein BDN71DRAFT_1021957 [Pleurotus eryngii]|uniref:Uncharacterized protein n=1 Tax=Pleurotus eryngii TaxID=5323 RepID=A0A9P6DEC9_PLEER|nr:hypothetical protein BDN71DRAFT_1021957 [Pleurotus eryngii]